MFKYYKKALAQGVLEYKTLTSFDGLVYIMNIPLFVISLLLTVVNVIMWLLEQMTFGKMILYLLVMMLLGYALLAFSAIITLVVEKRSIKKMLKGILTYPIFMATWAVINFVCIFKIKRNVKWDKIEHKKAVSIDDMKSK